MPVQGNYRSMEIVLIITSLNAGGAEGALLRLAGSMKDSHSQSVICFREKGIIGDQLEGLGIPVHYLDMKAGRLSVRGMWKLLSIIRTKKSENVVVQTWLYHADLVGGVVARLCGIKTICWGIRNNRIDANATATRLVARVCAFLSGEVPKKIISCSNVAAEYHRSMGYANKFSVIPNGFDTARRQVSNHEIERFKNEIDVENRLLLGCVARWDPQKDHRNLLVSTARWSHAEDKHDFTLVLVGSGCEWENDELTSIIRELGLEDNVKLLGYRSDVNIVLAACDLHILSSKSEAFPNVIAESMLCGTPNVATNVGDAAEIVGETGWLVEPEDSDALAKMIGKAVGELKNPDFCDRLSDSCRERIIKNYSIDTMREQFLAEWESLAMAYRSEY